MKRSGLGKGCYSAIVRRRRRADLSALAGLPHSIIGGSVSTGHGLQPGEDTWHSHWFKAFQKEFPNSELFNGALPASGSNFFGWCFPALIPEDLDLYLLEVDVNNESVQTIFQDSVKAVLTLIRRGDAKNEPDDDALHRAILNLPQEPALIRLTVVATSFPDLSRGEFADEPFRSRKPG